MFYLDGYDPLKAPIVHRVGPSGEFPTLEAAWRSLPKGTDTHATIALERGQRWVAPQCIIRNGVDDERPFTICNFGDPALPRPQIVPLSGFGISAEVPCHDILFHGLNPIDPSRNPHDPAYEGNWETPWPRQVGSQTQMMMAERFGINMVSRCTSLNRVTFDRCKWSYISATFANNNPAITDPLSAIQNLLIRRCQFHEAWSYRYNSDGSDRRPSGIHGTRCPFRLEDSFIYSGGWARRADGTQLRKTDGRISASIFNHGIYTDGCTGQEIENCVIVDSSSIGMKLESQANQPPILNRLIRDNLIIGGEVGIVLSSEIPGSPVPAPGTPYAAIGTELLDNVLIRPGDNAPTGRVISWGWDFQECGDVLASGNLVIAPVDPRITKPWAYLVEKRSSGRIVDNSAVGFSKPVEKLTSAPPQLWNGEIRHRPGRSIPNPDALLPGGSRAAYVERFLGMDDLTWDSSLCAEAVNPRFRAMAWGQQAKQSFVWEVA